MKIGRAGFAVFILFFGGALVDAIATHNWARAVFWLALGALFLIADNLRRPLQTKQ